ncbi:hypothetical protein JHN63_24075 [Streptomyces sp. MBT65]|uniref:hypothetical protein n=1 Tax=Streptomyces sp. MBT65 TaxID=1488395 RepID=UPI00190CB4D4|nr:hypothetical protein [Streptomyces sp. MBT65]MBK3576828.1 hypothetical protein [Streptomyces sp. MBT65]
MGSRVFLVLNQLVYTHPGDIRNARPVPSLIQAAIGIVQDTLIRLLVSWLNSETYWSLHVSAVTLTLRSPDIQG